MALAEGENAQIEKCMKFFSLSAAQAVAWKDTEKIGMAPAQGDHLQIIKCMGFLFFVHGPGRRAQTPSLLSTAGAVPSPLGFPSGIIR